MAEVSIKYKGNTIAELNEDGKKTLKTSGMYCKGDIEVDYVRPTVVPDESDEPDEVVPANYKQFSFTSASAVAAQYVTVVSGDPDVAEHHADTTAMVTVRKIKDVSSENGLTFIMAGNMAVMGKYGLYGNHTASSGNSNAAPISYPISSNEGVGTEIHVVCNANGDIKVYCGRTQNNFGGAEYDIRFSW